MKAKLLFATACAAALISAGAQAASVPSGFYIGVNVGYDMGDTATSSVATAGASSWFDPTSIPAINSTGPFDLDEDGINGGAQVGYLMTHGGWAWGVEADFTYMGRDHSDSATGIYPCCSPDEFTNSQAMERDWLATVRGRLGFDIGGTLLYGTGGLAIGDASYLVGWTDPQDWPALTVTSVSDTLLGWTAGGGIQTMFAPNLSAKVEYLYVDLGSVSAAPVVITGPGFDDTIEGSADFKQHTVRLGINLHF